MLGFHDMKKRKAKAPQLHIRAELGTVNEAERTVETVFSTGVIG